MSYFLGNILGPLATQPEQHDPTFCFTHEEARDLDLTDVPIRLEHHPDMTVGKIDRCFQGHDGSKWIVAHIDENSIQSHFASKAIRPNKRGFTYYTGLSLQHEHIDFADGTSKKRPVEVSLCVSPRRSDCRIHSVLKAGPRSYISRHRAHKMADPAPETPKETTETSNVPAENSMNEDLKRALLMQEEKIKQLMEEKKLRDEADKKKAEEEEAERLKKLELERAKADAMFQAVAENWQQQLPKEDFPDEVKNQIQNFIQQSPEQSQELLRLAHCASKHYEAKAKAFEEALKAKAVQETRDDLVQSVTKKRKVVHAASTKAQPERSVMDVLAQYRTKAGNGRELMMEKLEIDRERQARMPYY